MVRQKNRRIRSGSGLVGSFDDARSQLGILSGPHDIKVMENSIFQTRSSDTSRNSGRFFPVPNKHWGKTDDTLQEARGILY